MEPGLTDWGNKSPKAYIQRFTELLIDAHEPAETQLVEATLLATDGPLEEVTWFALDEYDDHLRIYRGDDQDQSELRRLHRFNPTQQQMPQLKTYFNQNYTHQSIEHATVIHIPDTYNPQLGRNPGVKVGVTHNPNADQISVGLKARPLNHYDRVIEDVNKLVPADDIESFINRIDYQLIEELREEANQHLLEEEIESVLANDPDFQRETTKPVPDGTHPEYAGMEAELWQKPISKVEYVDSSQGFLQVWQPVEETEIGIVTTTEGDYEEDTVIEEFSQRFDEQTST